MTQIKQVNCPTCAKQVPWTEESEFRPFCSERCKLIDFGEWATEKNVIEGDSLYPTEEKPDEKLQ